MRLRMKSLSLCAGVLTVLQLPPPMIVRSVATLGKSKNLRSATMGTGAQKGTDVAWRVPKTEQQKEAEGVRNQVL